MLYISIQNFIEFHNKIWKIYISNYDVINMIKYSLDSLKINSKSAPNLNVYVFLFRVKILITYCRGIFSFTPDVVNQTQSKFDFVAKFD